MLQEDVTAIRAAFNQLGNTIDEMEGLWSKLRRTRKLIAELEAGKVTIDVRVRGDSYTFLDDAIYRLLIATEREMEETLVERLESYIKTLKCHRLMDGPPADDGLTQDMQELVDYWREEDPAEGNIGDGMDLTPIQNALRVLRSKKP